MRVGRGRCTAGEPLAIIDRLDVEALSEYETEIHSPVIQHAQPDPCLLLRLLPFFRRVALIRSQGVPLGRVDRLARLERLRRISSEEFVEVGRGLQGRGR